MVVSEAPPELLHRNFATTIVVQHLECHLQVFVVQDFALVACSRKERVVVNLVVTLLEQVILNVITDFVLHALHDSLYLLPLEDSISVFVQLFKHFAQLGTLRGSSINIIDEVDDETLELVGALVVCNVCI